jgi:hypothetical protein
VNGNCDEVTTRRLADRRARKWERTLDEVGQPVNGQPAFSVSQYTIMVTTPSVIYAFDPISGIDRFVFSQQNCVIHGSVLGLGRRVDQPDLRQAQLRRACHSAARGRNCCCATARTRATTATARIRTASSGTRSATPTCRRQLISWCPRSTRPPASCSVSTPRQGKPLSTIPVQSTAGSPRIDQVATSGADLVLIGGITYAIDLTHYAAIWHVASAQLPTVTAPSGRRQLGPRPGHRDRGRSHGAGRRSARRRDGPGHAHRRDDDRLR